MINPLSPISYIHGAPVNTRPTEAVHLPASAAQPRPEVSYCTETSGNLQELCNLWVGSNVSPGCPGCISEMVRKIGS